MKAQRIIYICFFILLVFFIVPVQSQESSRLDGTSWQVVFISNSHIDNFSTAILKFSDGELAITDWIYNLSPGSYEEYLHEDLTYFSAHLWGTEEADKQLTLSIQGFTTSDEKIAGSWVLVMAVLGEPFDPLNPPFPPPLPPPGKKPPIPPPLPRPYPDFFFGESLAVSQ